MKLVASPYDSAKMAGIAFDLSIVLLTLAMVVALIGVTLTRFPLVTLTGPRLFAVPSAPTTLAPTTAASFPSDDTLELIVGGRAQPLPSGGQFPLDGSLVGQVALAHQSDRPYFRQIDLTLSQTSGASSFVTNAEVRASLHMSGMDMGGFQQTATQVRPGTYRLPLAFSMSGAWQVDLQLTTPTTRQVVNLELFAWT